MKNIALPFRKRNENSLKYGIIFFVFACIIAFIIFNRKHNITLYHCSLFTIGWLLWTYSEYLWHRFLMHDKNKEAKHNQPNRHQFHHQHPNELKIKLYHRVLMMIGLCIAAIISVKLNNAFTLFTGFYFGFMLFCYIHVALHHRWSAKLFPKLLTYHIYHHLKHPDTCFGVSVTWWDDFFGTVPTNNKTISAKVMDFYFHSEKNHD